MNRYRRYIPIIAVVLVALGFNLERFGIDLEALSRGESIVSTTSSGNSLSGGQKTQHGSGPKWSSTSPEINLWHVFDGEINRRGDPVGYHSRPGGVDAPNSRVVSIKDKANSHGVYTANIEIRDGQQWKSKFSSFFPDDMSKQEVIDVILQAYKNSNNKGEPNARWQGPSGLGFTVQGYTSSKGGINTAFPLYVR